MADLTIQLLSAIAQVANLLLRSPDYNAVLSDVTRLLGKAVGSDRCSVLQNRTHSASMAASPEWKQGFWWETISEYSELLSRGEVINLLTLSLEKPVRSLFEQQGITSMLVVPILANEQFWGIIRFDTCGEHRLYGEVEIAILKTAADSISAAIERQFKETERQLSALTDMTAQREVEAAFHAEIAERHRTEQLARGQTEVLINTLAVLAAHPVLDNFLGYVLRAITEQLGDCSSSIWLYSEPHDTTILHLNYEDGQMQQGSQITRLGTVNSILRQWDLEFLPALREQKVLIQEVEQLNQMAEYARSRQSHNQPRNVKRILVIALFFGDTFFGNITLRRSTSLPYTPEQVELARALAHQATLAIQLIQLTEHSRQTAVLEERNRLACEIHDTIAQGLMGIIAQLHAADQRRKHNLDDVQLHLHAACQLAKDCLTEARRSVWALRPHMLDSNTLSDAIGCLAHQMTAHTGTALHLNLQATPDPLPPIVEDHLLRITQEALANTLHHAQAESVWVTLELKSHIRLSIRDNGQGFDPKQTTTGFGLTSLRSRSQLIQAHLTIHSQPDAGTTITVLIPHNLARRDR